MREWRKFFKNIVNSNKISNISTDAYFLYTAIILYQGDDGLYPWDEIKAQSLCVTRRGWDFEHISKCLEELIDNDLIFHHGKYVEVINHKNPNPYPWRDELNYDIEKPQKGKEKFRIF